jgi:hypothetical protein
MIGRERSGVERKRGGRASGSRDATRKSVEHNGRRRKAARGRQQESLLLSIPRLDARLIRVLVVIIIRNNYFRILRNTLQF